MMIRGRGLEIERAIHAPNLKFTYPRLGAMVEKDDAQP